MASQWLKARQTKFAAYAATYVLVVIAVIVVVNVLADRYNKSYEIGRASCRERVEISDECVAEDGIRDGHVTGVQTCALPILIFLGIFFTARSMESLRWRS